MSCNIPRQRNSSTKFFIFLHCIFLVFCRSVARCYILSISSLLCGSPNLGAKVLLFEDIHKPLGKFILAQPANSPQMGHSTVLFSKCFDVMPPRYVLASRHTSTFLPYLFLPYHTLPYLTLSYLTLPYLTLPYLTLPYLTLSYHTIPYASPLSFLQPLEISPLPRIVVPRKSLSSPSYSLPFSFLLKINIILHYSLFRVPRLSIVCLYRNIIVTSS